MKILNVAMCLLALIVCGAACGRENASEDSESTANDRERIRLERRTLEVDGHARRYLIHVPEGLSPDAPVPLLMMLHGGGGTGRAAGSQTGWHLKAEREGFIAVFPEATSPNPDAPGRFMSNPQVWNDGSGRFTSKWHLADDVRFIGQLLDEMIRMHPIDPTRIYVTGFSNGASMAFRIGVELAAQVAAVAPVAGALWLDAPQPERSVPLCYITGAADTLNPLEGGVPRTVGGREMGDGMPKPPVRDSVLTWVDMLGCPKEAQHLDAPEGVTAVRYGPCEDSTEVRWYTIADSGHTWPGGAALLPERVVGKKTDRIDATELIWQFFCEHRLPRATH